MTIEVWVSTHPDPDRSALGPQWALAGQLDQGREDEVWKVVQGYLGLRAESRWRSVEFYADLDPDSEGYRALHDAVPGDDLARSRLKFWLALRWGGPPPRVFFTARQAQLATLQRRPPPPHPGRRELTRPVGVKLVENARSGLFDMNGDA